MAQLTDETVTDAFDRAVKNAAHLRVRDAPAVAAARALAKKIDAWDVIVDWALEDAAESSSRPAVPANDNVSLASFLKYLEKLQLLPPEAVSQPPGASTSPKGGLAAWRDKAGVGN